MGNYHEINLTTEGTEDTERGLISWSPGDGGPSCRPSSTTPHTGNKKKKFIITHPLHPFHGQEFESINYRHGSKISSISFYDSNGGSHFVPVEWTDIFPEDPFLKISGGRSLFRYEDLVDLFHLIETMESELSKK